MKHRLVGAIVALLLAAVAVVAPSAQSPVRSGVSFVELPPDLRPEMVDLTIRDAKSGAGVSHALVCLERKGDWAVTNEFGQVRLGNLPRGGQRIRVEALGFAPESLVVEATRNDRRAAVIRLKRRAEKRPTLACE